MAKEPEPATPRLVRRSRTARADLRQLRAALHQLVPAAHRASRAADRALWEQRRRTARLRSDADTLEIRIQKTQHRLERAKERKKRAASLVEKNAANAETLEQKKAKVERLRLELRRLKREREAIKKQVERADERLATLTERADDGGGELRKEEERLREALADARKRRKRVETALAEDRKRAEAVRTARRRQVELRIREARSRRRSLRKDMRVQAPAAGEVVFREPAPRAVRKNAPLLVTAPVDGLRVRARLPASERWALERADTVGVEAQEPMIQRRFAGRFVRAEPLPRDDGRVVAELVADAPAAAVRKLVSGEGEDAVEVRLRWTPPLWTSPWALLGTAMAVTGGLLAIVALVRSGRAASEGGDTHEAPASDERAVAVPDRTGAEAATAYAEHPSGSLGTMLRLLGQRLRQALADGEIDPSLLAAIEWALDRHHARAVELIGDGLGADDHLEEDVLRWLGSAGPRDGGSGNGHESTALLRGRLHRVLSAVGGGPVQAALGEVRTVE